MYIVILYYYYMQSKCTWEYLGLAAWDWDPSASLTFASKKRINARLHSLSELTSLTQVFIEDINNFCHS